MMIRFKTSIAALAIGITIALSQSAAAENVLRWASLGGALTADPHAYDEVPTTGQIRQVYESLLTFDSNLNLVPGLATAWRLVEPRIWELELRRDVRFHDGTPLTANDVVFSFRRAKADIPAGFADYVESIADVLAVDEHTVRFETSVPDPQLMDQLRQICIMSAHWVRAHDARLPANVSAGEENYASRHANGTGPFMLKEFEPNGRIVMVRNPDWWGLEQQPHNIDRIEYIPIADPKERLAALLEGELDLLTDPPLSALDRISNTPGLKLAEGAELRTIYLGLDQASPELRSSNVKGRNPFRDRRVRQAIYQGIDIEAIRADIMQGLAIPAGMMVPPRALGYTPELDRRLAYDPEAARALLAEAGYPEGFSVTLDCPNNRYVNDEATCRAVAAQLAEVGLAVTADAQPKEVMFAKYDNRETDFYLLGWATYDSHNIFSNFYKTRGPENAPGYSNPKVDELIDSIGRTTVTYARDAMIEEVWKIVLDDIVYIPLHYQMIVWAMRDNLELAVYPYNRPIFAEARFK